MLIRLGIVYPCRIVFEEDVIKFVSEFQLSTGWRNITIEKQNFTINVGIDLALHRMEKYDD